MRFLLPLIFLLLGIGGGVGVGLFLNGETPMSETTVVSTAGEQRSEEDTEDDNSEVVSGTTEYVRLNNQFVVPIVRHGTVRSLVVMSLSLEVDAGQNAIVFNQEPRLRDGFLQVMFAHANAGGFDGSFTQAAAMAPLREALAETARAVLGAIVRDILIVDITRQDA